MCFLPERERRVARMYRARRGPGHSMVVSGGEMSPKPSKRLDDE